MKKIVIIILGLLVVVGAVLFLVFRKTNGESYIKGHEELYQIAIDYLLEEENQEINPDKELNDYHFFASYDGLGITEDQEYQYAYMWILGEGYYRSDGEVLNANGYSMFFKFTFKDNQVIRYQNAEDGSYYTSSISKMCIDRRMRNIILRYRSQLSNQELVDEYYSQN